jgi:hypothetical protein
VACPAPLRMSVVIHECTGIGNRPTPCWPPRLFNVLHEHRYRKGRAKGSPGFMFDLEDNDRCETEEECSWCACCEHATLAACSYSPSSVCASLVPLCLPPSLSGTPCTWVTVTRGPGSCVTCWDGGRSYSNWWTRGIHRWDTGGTVTWTDEAA